MTNRNTFNINDINLADFCPLTLKDISKRRYRPFVNLLDTFDLDEKVYIKDYLTYFPYVLKGFILTLLQLPRFLLHHIGRGENFLLVCFCASAGELRCEEPRYQHRE